MPTPRPQQDPYVEFRQYRAMAGRYKRAQRRRANLRWAGVCGAAAVGGFGAVWLYMQVPTQPRVWRGLSNVSSPASARAYYRNCDAARAAGVAPIYRGEPGYRPALDADNDGIACEPWRRRRW